jgi:hypothetical protein
MTMVRPIGTTIAIIRRSKDNDVVTTTERILENCSWTKVDIRVMARRLIGGRTIKVPVGELAYVSDLLRERLSKDDGIQ